MGKELNYPIKYAILELKEPGGWPAHYKNITQGFIVSKCYVVESKIRYHSNGKYEMMHKVVFPYNNISDFKLSMKQGNSYNEEEKVPLYDACFNPYPIDVVYDLFDSFEEAQKVAFAKIQELKKRIVLRVSVSDENWKDKYEQLKKEFIENLIICKKYEEYILEKTKNMLVLNNIEDVEYKKQKKKVFNQ